jgi:hypothetical protein
VVGRPGGSPRDAAGDPVAGFRDARGSKRGTTVTDDARRSEGTRIELLYFDGCPTYLEAERTLREILAEEGVRAPIALVAVNSDEEARRLRFPGSPTIRADGRDLFPIPDRSAWALGCRMYSTPEGLKGTPTSEMLRAALGLGVQGPEAR